MLAKIEELNDFRIPVIANHPFITNEHYTDVQKPKKNKQKVPEEEAPMLPTFTNVEYEEPEEDDSKLKRRRIIKKDQTLISQTGRKKAEKPNK